MEIFSYSEDLGKWMEVGNSGMFRPEMLRPMGLPEDVNVIAWGLSLFYLFGTLEFLGKYDGLSGIPALSLFGIDLSKCSIHPRKNLSWHQFELPVKSDRTFKVVAGEYMFKLTHEARMWIIKGFNSNQYAYNQYAI